MRTRSYHDHPVTCSSVYCVEPTKLEHFLAVVEEGSFTSAARRLYMVQSSLSASLLSLERTLGAELFIRGRRGAELTDAGRALLEPARAALGSLQAAHDAVAEVTGLLHGTVRIACMPSLPPSIDLGRTIRWFNEKYPDVEIQVLPAIAATMVKLVAEGQVDFAVTPWVEGRSPNLRFQPLVCTKLALACPSGHRLAGAREVRPPDVLDELIVDLPRTWQARALFESVLSREGGARKVRLEVHDWTTALRMVSRGTGITYGPLACMVGPPFDGLDVATIEGAGAWEIGVVTRDEALRGTAGQAFLAAYLGASARARHVGSG